MQPEELMSLIKRIQYQIQTISETIDSESYPIESLILSMNWGEEEIDIAHDVFESFDNKLGKGEQVNWQSFEKEFQVKLNIGYQSLKLIVLAFYKNNQWENVCRSYAMSFEPTTPIEFHNITRTK